MENLKTKGAVAATVLALGGLAGVALASNDGRPNPDPSATPGRQTADRSGATGPEAAGDDEGRENPRLAPEHTGSSPVVTSSSGGSGDDEGEHGEQYRSEDDHDSGDPGSEGTHDEDDD